MSLYGNQAYRVTVWKSGLSCYCMRLENIVSSSETLMLTIIIGIFCFWIILKCQPYLLAVKTLYFSVLQCRYIVDAVLTSEPQLQPLSGEQLLLLTANSNDHARLDVAATNFWSNNRQRSFFDIRVFNPLASSNRTPSIASVYQKHEREKRRGYDQRVREIENGSFSPLVFNTLGGWDRPRKLFTSDSLT